MNVVVYKYFMLYVNFLFMILFFYFHAIDFFLFGINFNRRIQKIAEKEKAQDLNGYSC